MVFSSSLSILQDELDDSKYLGHLYGLGTPGLLPSEAMAMDTAAEASEVA